MPYLDFIGSLKTRFVAVEAVFCEPLSLLQGKIQGILKNNRQILGQIYQEIAEMLAFSRFIKNDNRELSGNYRYLVKEFAIAPTLPMTTAHCIILPSRLFSGESASALTQYA